MVPGATGTPAAAIRFRALILSPIAVIASALGPTQIRPCSAHGAGEVGVLRQEAVAGVDRLGAGRLRGGQDRLGVAVGRRRVGRADQDRLVGLRDERHAGVGFRVDRDRADAEPLGGADDPAGDLAPVRDEQRADHAGWSPTVVTILGYRERTTV